MAETQTQQTISRKNILMAVGLVLIGLTLVSAAASYSIYVMSFKDWQLPMQRFFGVLITLGVEVAFLLLIRGMESAYSGIEMPIAAVGAASLLVAMALNFVVHNAIVANRPLEPWQDEWRAWVGLVIPFYTIALFVILAFVSPEANERRQERRINFVGRQRALEYRENYLNSKELERQLEGTQDYIAEEVRQHITKQLPAPRGEFASQKFIDPK